MKDDAQKELEEELAVKYNLTPEEIRKVIYSPFRFMKKVISSVGYSREENNYYVLREFIIPRFIKFIVNPRRTSKKK